MKKKGKKAKGRGKRYLVEGLRGCPHERDNPGEKEHSFSQRDENGPTQLSQSLLAELHEHAMEKRTIVLG